MTGHVVELVGPDGSGKSSVAEALADALVPPHTDVLRRHWRPMVLPPPGRRRSAAPSTVTRPHAAPPHPRWLSVLLLAYYLCDVWLGHLLHDVPARRRGGLVLVERGWFDMAVDPRRYRLAVSPALVRRLGRLVPRPDLRVVLDGPPALLHARKPELPLDEIDRQRRAWWRVADADADTEVVDVSAPLDDVVAGVAAHLAGGRSSTPPPTVAVPRRGRARVQVPAAPRRAAVAGLGLYQPSATPARLATGLATGLARAGLLRALPRGPLDPAWLAGRLAPHVPRGGSVAVLATNHADRWVARIMDRRGEAVAVAKVVGPAGDAGALDREAAALAGSATTLPAPLRAPHLLDHDDGLLLVESFRRRPRRAPWRLDPDVAEALGAWFAADLDAGGRGPAHGDLAPWNLLRVDTGWALVDWEHADRAGPFHDLVHHLVQAHAMLGRPRRDELLRGVRGGHGDVGVAVAAWASGAGWDRGEVAEVLRAYLAAPPAHLRPTGPGGRPEGDAARRALADALGPP